MGTSLYVAARVLPHRYARRPRTRVIAAVIDARGQWVTAPRELASLPGRADLPIAISNDGDRVSVAIVRPHAVLRVSVPASDGEPLVTREMAAPRRRTIAPRIATVTGGFRVLWPGRDTSRIETLPARFTADGAETTGNVAARMPGPMLPTQIAASDDGGTAMVMETPGHRYYAAFARADGRMSFNGFAPAGCDGGECPSVQLSRAAADGVFLAQWSSRVHGERTLRTHSARLFDARLRPVGAVVTTMPMRRGVAFALGDRPLIAQLARPIVVRGEQRPVALAQRADTSEQPVALAVVADGATATVLSSTAAGAMTLATLRCARP